jgi:DNA repair protein REV1
MARQNGASTAEPSDTNEEISESFLAALPEDMRAEVLEQQKRDRIRARSGLSYGTTKRKTKPTDSVTVYKAHQTIPLPTLASKPTFTSRKLSTVQELRKAMSMWVEEFSDENEDGPYEEDIAALAVYLGKVVSEEKDMDKAVGVVRWLDHVLSMQDFSEGGNLTKAWAEASEALQNSIQQAVQQRGLPPVDFE